MNVCAVCEFWVEDKAPEPLGALSWVMQCCLC